MFDVCEGKIAGYVPAGHDDLFAAGAQHVFVLDSVRGVLQRFPFATLKADAAQRLPMRSRPKVMAMGSASQGPLLVGCGYFHSPEGADSLFVDAKTLGRIDQAVCSLPRGSSDRPDGQTPLHASADGRVFTFYHTGLSPSSVVVLRICGRHVKAAELNESVGRPLCDATGQHIYTAGGICSNRAQIEDKRYVMQSSILVPAVDGPFYFQLPVSFPPRHLRQEPPAVLFSNDQAEPLAEIPALPERFMQCAPGYNASIHDVQHIYFVPKAQVIAMLATSGDAVVLRRFNIEEELAKAGRNYVFVMSSPPGIVRLGETLRYQLDVRSRAGGVTYKLEAGPKGMTVSDTGLVSWTAKTRAGGEVAHCEVAIRDSQHKTIHHAFDLDLDDVAPAEIAGTNAARPVGFRTFHDKSGKFKVEAVFQSLVAGKVLLKRNDGSTVVVPLEMLSGEDQQWVREHGPTAPASPDMAPPKTTVKSDVAPASAGQASAWIADSLALVAEAREHLAKADLPDKPTNLPREIDELEHDLRLLGDIKRKGLEPLLAYLRVMPTGTIWERSGSAGFARPTCLCWPNSSPRNRPPSRHTLLCRQSAMSAGITSIMAIVSRQFGFSRRQRLHRRCFARIMSGTW